MTYATCHYCHRRFILRKVVRGRIFKTTVMNYVILSDPSDDLKYAHNTCYKRYKKNKIKKRKYMLSGGLNTGFADVRGEIEES